MRVKLDDRHDAAQTAAPTQRRRSVRKFSISSWVFVRYSVSVAMRSMTFERAVMARAAVAVHDYIAVAVHSAASFLAMVAVAVAGN